MFTEVQPNPRRGSGSFLDQSHPGTLNICLKNLLPKYLTVQSILQPPNFNNLAVHTSEDYFNLTGLHKEQFQDLASLLPSYTNPKIYYNCSKGIQEWLSALTYWIWTYFSRWVLQKSHDRHCLKVVWDKHWWCHYSSRWHLYIYPKKRRLQFSKKSNNSGCTKGKNYWAIVLKMNEAIVLGTCGCTEGKQTMGFSNWMEQWSASVPSWRSIWDDLRKYSFTAEIEMLRHCKRAPASVLVHTLGNGDPSNQIRHYFIVNQTWKYFEMRWLN